MKYIAKRVGAGVILAAVGLFCFAGSGVAEKMSLPPELQGHVEMVLVTDNADNALDLVKILIRDNPDYAMEIAATAAKLRPGLANEFMALVTAPAPAPTPTNVDLPRCPPEQTGEAFLDCLPPSPGLVEPVVLSSGLLETLENPSVVSQSQ